MGEILSQSEIDALLSALSSGELSLEEKPEETKQKVKKYDFKRPNKFSKEHVKTLEMVHENFARIASNYLTANLRTSVQIKVISTEQLTYEEFIHSIPNPTILVTYFLEPFNGIFLFETGPQFVFQVIDILFGGEGKELIKVREFTEIEKNIIKKINIKLIESLKLAWEDVIDVEPRFDSLETNPVLNQFLAPNEPVELITMQVQINNNQSFINMCIPYISVEKYIDRLIIQYRTNLKTELDSSTTKKLEKNIMNVEVNTHVELGKSLITVKDFLNLNVGDCIKLNTKISDSLNYYIENKLHYKVYPGSIGKKLGIQISNILDKDVEDDE
ncbi:flagellar motor switch protein FliM [Thermobrachium celere]|uniref:Flagellar motor switch protein FliM n=1 Tax=Thermobrachium celere DSM 8682 TaxID=941824 RepID=R7RPE7_9CLOT|nr:flagellar motor switch protein FliM [Thermobrachium celere]CDF58037.1 Flagellar motor switch protein FliM [Thermobrachium celere DSM 8682]